MKTLKVGTWTTGVGFICIGIFIILYTNGWASWHVMSYLWPLLIIGFGLELIFSRVGRQETRTRVSGLAVVFIIIVSLASLGQFTLERVGNALNWKVAFGPSYLSKVNGSVNVDDGVKRVDVEIVSGEVTLTGVDGNTVSYDGNLPIPASSQADADKQMKDDWKVVRDGDTLVLKLDEQRSISVFGFHEGKAYLNVQLPKALLSKVVEANGSVNVKQVNNDSDVQTANGSVTFESIQGHVIGTTVNGSCTADEVQGDVEFRTTNGHVGVTNAKGRVTIHTTNGSVNVTGAIGGNWDVHTTNGSIDLETTKDASATFTADTTLGKVHGDLDWSYDGDSKRHATAKMGTGQFDVQLSTTNGGITVNTNQ